MAVESLSFWSDRALSAVPQSRYPAARRNTQLSSAPNGAFLLRLFPDRELLKLPWQDVLGKFIAKRRAPKVRALYDAVGGGSPILKWTRAQGDGMCARLDVLSPESAPHRFYVAVRYAPPFADDALLAMHADGIERAVAFTQYPQWSCTTTGSSLNDLWRALSRQGLEVAFEWSVLDRWGDDDGFVRSVAGAIRDGLEQYAPHERDEVLLLYSAHSLPLSVIDRADAYPAEVAPIAFTSDHIETLSEIDIEYAHLASSLGMTGFRRAPSLNARPAFLDALAGLVSAHLDQQTPHSTQYRSHCPGCSNAACRSLPANVVQSHASSADVIAAV